MHSQNDEEKYILDFFKDKTNGNLLEIGTYDPFKFSNTRALIERGWKATLVEPSPICMNNIRKVYGSNRNITLVEKAVTDNDGTVIFYESNGDAIGTTDISHKDKWQKGYSVDYKQMTVDSIAMVTLCETYGYEYDFLNIDVEGCNKDLFNLIPLKLLQYVKLICIEHDGHDYYMTEQLAKQGYSFIHRNAENLIMGRK